MTVDTLSLAQRLRGGALTAEQADAIAAAIGNAVGESAASKADMVQIRTEIKGDFAALEQRLEALEQRLTAKIEGARSSLLIWVVGVLFAFGGLGLAFAKL